MAVVLDSPTSMGDNVTFTCSVFGSSPPAIEWTRVGPDGVSFPLSDSSIQSDNVISATNMTSTITIPGIQFSDRGVYRCFASQDLYNEIRVVVAGNVLQM